MSLPASPSLKFLQIAGALSGMVLVVAILTAAGLRDLYFAHPAAPVPAEGKTVAVLVRGTTRYITQEQWLYTQWSFDVAVIAGVVCAALVAAIAIKSRKAKAAGR